MAPDRFSDEELYQKLYAELEQIAREKRLQGVFQSFADGEQPTGRECLAPYASVEIGVGWDACPPRAGLRVEDLMTEGPGALIEHRALRGRWKAFTSVIAKGPVEVVNLTREVLETAMAQSFNFTVYFTNVLCDR